ncbi:MAG: hypothetical protein V3T81_07030 [Thermoanaerobaculia bacterium]
MVNFPLSPDFRDLLHAFVDHDVRFLIVGAYALAVHGHPRATGDLDVWIEPTEANASRAYRALAAFGAPLDELTEGDLSTPGVVFQIGVAPARIDILTEISGVAFEAAWPRRIEGHYGSLAVPVIGRDDFVANKRATGRAKDALDADLLEKLDGEPA